MRRLEIHFSFRQISVMILAVFLSRPLLFGLSASEKQSVSPAQESIIKIARNLYRKILTAKKTVHRMSVILATRGVEKSDGKQEPVCDWPMESQSVQVSSATRTGNVRVRLSELEEFQKSVELIGNGKLDKSLEDLTLFLSKYPQSPLALDARELKNKLEGELKK